MGYWSTLLPAVNNILAQVPARKQLFTGETTGAAYRGNSPEQSAGIDREHQLCLTFCWYMIYIGLISTLRMKKNQE
jgi:hypothetical protein